MVILGMGPWLSQAWGCWHLRAAHVLCMGSLPILHVSMGE